MWAQVDRWNAVRDLAGDNAMVMKLLRRHIVWIISSVSESPRLFCDTCDKPPYSDPWPCGVFLELEHVLRGNGCE